MVNDGEINSAVKFPRISRQRKMSVHFKICLFLFCLALLPFSAQAQRQQARCEQAEPDFSQIEELNETIAADVPTTYLELFKRLYPSAVFDIKSKKTTVGKSIQFHGLRNQFASLRNGEAAELKNIRALYFSNLECEHLALLFDLFPTGAEAVTEKIHFQMLAVFRLKPLVELVDAAYVDLFPNADFWKHNEVLEIKRNGETAFWLAAKSNENSAIERKYALISLFSSKGERMSVILERLPPFVNEKNYPVNTTVFLEVEPSGEYRSGHRVFDLHVVRAVRVVGELKADRMFAETDARFVYQASWNERGESYRISPKELISEFPVGGKFYIGGKPQREPISYQYFYLVGAMQRVRVRRDAQNKNWIFDKHRSGRYRIEWQDNAALLPSKVKPGEIYEIVFRTIKIITPQFPKPGIETYRLEVLRAVKRQQN